LITDISATEIHLDLELARFLRDDDPREIVRLRILLPVDEVLLGRDAHRVGEDRRARVRRRAQADTCGPAAPAGRSGSA
jgi:hypothetical protein